MSTIPHSNSPSQTPSHDIQANINYFPPTPSTIPPSLWKPRHLDHHDAYTRKMTIHDIRGQENNFTLDRNGFQFVTLPKKERNTETDEDIIREYYPEMEALAREITGATKAHPFHHALRQHSSPTSHKLYNPSTNRYQTIPSGHPHVDYSGTPADIAGTLREIPFPRHILPLFTNSPRFSFINIWRPLVQISKDPLALADATTVPDGDYIIRERVFTSGVRSGNYVLAHSREVDTHMWYYLNGMRENEVVVFKGLDSEREGAWRCPHTAVRVERMEGEGPRESVEVRVVCFWE